MVYTVNIVAENDKGKDSGAMTCIPELCVPELFVPGKIG
jgi:hypothetical protein